VTRTPGSTKRTNRVASKNHTSGIDKIFFLSDLIPRSLRGKHTEKSDQNSEKKFSVLAGLIPNHLGGGIMMGGYIQIIGIPQLKLRITISV
jgi:hypothetical protein